MLQQPSAQPRRDPPIAHIITLTSNSLSNLPLRSHPIRLVPLDTYILQEIR